MAESPVRDVNPEEAQQMVDEGALLLDVREADEWEAGHAPAAVWIPLGELPARIGELSASEPIVAICRSGSRSRAVAEALTGAGFDVVNVDGGMRAWVVEDLPIVAADGLPGVVI
jgi:rhodanese-related sulfurtransferase